MQMHIHTCSIHLVASLDDILDLSLELIMLISIRAKA